MMKQEPNDSARRFERHELTENKDQGEMTNEASIAFNTAKGPPMISTRCLHGGNDIKDVTIVCTLGLGLHKKVIAGKSSTSMPLGR